MFRAWHTLNSSLCVSLRPGASLGQKRFQSPSASTLCNNEQPKIEKGQGLKKKVQIGSGAISRLQHEGTSDAAKYWQIHEVDLDGLMGKTDFARLQPSTHALRSNKGGLFSVRGEVVSQAHKM